MNAPDVRKLFESNCYYVAKNIVPKTLLQETLQGILKSIEFCANELSVAQDDYLSAVSRWLAPSAVTSAVSEILLKHIAQTTETILRDTPLLSKFNVICKNEYSSAAVPYHQDISYSPDNPYRISAWLALQDVDINSGPLEVIAKSHKSPLKPAVDFWSPDYQPDASLKIHAVKIPLSAGDIVFFDSALWHGSSENTARSSRYAVVTRWSVQAWIPDQVIPQIQPAYFGMWTSGKITHELLTKGAELLFKVLENDFVILLDLWIEKLKKVTLPFSINQNFAIASLQRVKILHLAHLKHNGGDATGTVYKNLWHSLLLPLKDYLETLAQKAMVI